MHWTAFLAYRRFPANARVMDDTACIQCGYNLRSQMVASRCPECGQEVGNSIFLLAKPAIAARGARTAGTSYLAPLALILPMVFGTYWSIFVASGIAAIAALFRAVGVSDLRFNAALRRLPVLGSRLQAWWIATLIDLLAAVGWCGGVIAIANAPALQGPRAASLIMTLSLLWLISMIVSMWTAGGFGFALMDMLGYAWPRIEFRVQRIAMIILMALLPPLGLAMTLVPAPHLRLFIQAFLLLMLCAAALLTAVPLLHAATAAEESAETWDDVLESDRVELVPESSLPLKPEPPPIKLEPARSMSARPD